MRETPIMRLLMLCAALITAAACGPKADGPPEIVVDRTACAYCTMLISEPRYAAAYQVPGADAKVFDDIVCLLQAAEAETATGLRFWFHDGNDGEWIDGEAATFVSSPEFRTPMGGGLMAYRDAGAAKQAADKYRGEVIGRLPQLLTRKGGQS
jgi:copper chaperone NosL